MSRPGFLNPEEYQLLVAPVLEVCASLAAERGDPLLFNDLPCMTAVMSLVSGLGSLYYTANAPLGQGPGLELLEELPISVAVMVLVEGGIEPPLLEQMGRALRGVQTALRKSGLLEPEPVMLSAVWLALLREDPEAVRHALRLAARRVIAAVEELERQRRN
jgi:hypothetical protein